MKKFIFWFAVSGYFLTFLYYYGPRGIALSDVLFHALPFWMCILAIGGMPVPAVALLIAPVNALIYGAVGALLAFALTNLRTRIFKTPA